MKRTQYEELMQIVENENSIDLSDVEAVVSDLMRSSITGDEEFKDFDYASSPRKKLRDIAKLFDNVDLQVFGNADDYHNVSVSFAKHNMYDSACKVLQRGLQSLPYAVDLLADLIRYGISSGQFDLCKKPYTTLSKIPKDRWNWRAFSFSIDYLVETANHTNAPEKQKAHKQYALEMADQFIKKMSSDQSYYDKSAILRSLGDDEQTGQTEEDVLRTGLENVVVVPKCALRLADILLDRGEYQQAIDILWRCCSNTFRPQPDVNRSYAFLLMGLSKASKLFSEAQKNDYAEYEAEIKSMYKDFHTAFSSGLNRTFEKTASSAIKVISAQTCVEYPYVDTVTEDPYDF